MFHDDIFDAIAARRIGGPLERPHRHTSRGRRGSEDVTSYNPPRRPHPEGP